MLTINGTMPHQILFNGVDLTQVYARATAADTPVLVWTKGAISITGNKFYLKDAIHNQIRIYQNGTLKDTIAAGFSGTQTLSFTLASGNTLLIQIYNPSSGWSQNIYNGTVSSSAWYYENFTETTVNKTIPAGYVTINEVNNNPSTGWKCNTTWPATGVPGNWTLDGKVYSMFDSILDKTRAPVPTGDYPSSDYSEWDDGWDFTGSPSSVSAAEFRSYDTPLVAQFATDYFQNGSGTTDGTSQVTANASIGHTVSIGTLSPYSGDLYITTNRYWTDNATTYESGGEEYLRVLSSNGYAYCPSSSEVVDKLKATCTVETWLSLTLNTSKETIVIRTDTVNGTYSGDKIPFGSKNVTYYTYDYN